MEPDHQHMSECEDCGEIPADTYQHPSGDGTEYVLCKPCYERMMAEWRTSQWELGDTLVLPYPPSQIKDLDAAREAFKRQYGKTPEEARVDLERTLRAVSSAIKDIAQSFMSAWAQIWKRQLQPFLHAIYIEQGAPYGDTEEGLLRWMRELGEKRQRQKKSEAHDGE